MQQHMRMVLGRGIAVLLVFLGAVVLYKTYAHQGQAVSMVEQPEVFRDDCDALMRSVQRERAELNDVLGNPLLQVQWHANHQEVNAEAMQHRIGKVPIADQQGQLVLCPVVREFSFGDGAAFESIGRTGHADSDFTVASFDTRRTDAQAAGQTLLLQASLGYSADGRHEGISVEKGQLERGVDSGVSGFMLVTNDGRMQMLTRQDVMAYVARHDELSTLQDYIEQIVVARGHSLTQQKMPLVAGDVHPAIQNWSWYQHNTPHNYRFWVEYENGEKGLIDFHRGKKNGIGFRDVMEYLANRDDITNALIADVGVSEYGTFASRNGKGEIIDQLPLGGTNAKARFSESDGPGSIITVTTR